MIISAKDICKSYGTDVILKDISFNVNKGDRVGVVGTNGAGKTTLLDILNNETEADSGSVYIAAETETGYLKQREGLDPDLTVREQVLGIFSHLIALEEEIERITSGSNVAERVDELEELNRQYEERGGYRYKGDMRSVLNAMGFGEDMMNKHINTMSGGEKTRLALACMLLKKPDLLFLDEPTNHLDIHMLAWLEGYLSKYEGTVIIVSHDRYFLDKCVNRIFEIENHELTVYEGNYTAYASKKREIREIKLRTYQRQQEEIARQEAMIRMMKERGTEKLAKRAASREKSLERMEVLEAPHSSPDRMKLEFKEKYKSGQDVLKAENIGKSIDGKQIFTSANIHLRRGDKVCIVGANGIGKTTLLRILARELPPDTGRLSYGVNVDIGYYDQEITRLNGNNTVFDEIRQGHIMYTDTEIRKMLGRFMFTGDDVFLKVSELSGGERARLALIKLMMQGANLLLFDEPTNHLDIASKEVFEEAVTGFPGTCVIVSHDRYLLNRVPDRILDMDRDGIIEYPGKFDSYMQKKESMAARQTETTEEKRTVSGRKAETQRLIREKKEKEAEERRRRRQKEKLEDEIAALESETANLEAQLADPEISSDYEKLAEIGGKLNEKRELLEEKIEEWAELVD